MVKNLKWKMLVVSDRLVLTHILTGLPNFPVVVQKSTILCHSYSYSYPIYDISPPKYPENKEVKHLNQ